MFSGAICVKLRHSMRLFRKTKYLRLLIALAISMVVAQAAVAHHDLDHQQISHTEYCKAFSTHDLSASSSDAAPKLDNSIQSRNLLVVREQSKLFNSTPRGFSSRAPPVLG